MLDKTGLSGEVCENEAGSEGPRSDVACVGVCPALSAGGLVSVLFPRSLPFTSSSTLMHSFARLALALQ